MGREVRRVSADWVHPVYTSENARYPHQIGKHIPLFGEGFAELAAEWDEGAAKWEQGLVAKHKLVTDEDGNSEWEISYVSRELLESAPILSEAETDDDSYEDWADPRPDPAHYMPDWPEEERTHLMMYQNTTEGTPISPVFETAEELAQWLVDNDTSAYGDSVSSYEEWLEMIGPTETAGLKP